MSFNENEVARSTDGRFSEKAGQAAEISLSSESLRAVDGGRSQAPEVALDADIPGPQNGFLLPGRECECDVDFRCSNHDNEAEEAYYAGLVGNADPDTVRTTDAHGFDERWNT